VRQLEFGHQGWVRLSGVPDVVVMLRTEEWNGRRIIVDLVISGPPIDSGTLKAIPIGWIESAINTAQAQAHLAAQQDGVDALTAAINARHEEAFENELPGTGWVEPTRLGRPDGSDPDAFYRNVAAAYNAAVAESSKVAPRLAEKAGVPVPTVHRWISEARRRGFLPPARRGKAG
jgi:hypothetical protein